MESEGHLTSAQGSREVAAIRHTLLIDDRLRLEFLSNLSRLFREYEVPISNEVLSTLVIALPGELADGNDDDNGWHADAGTAKKTARSELEKSQEFVDSSGEKSGKRYMKPPNRPHP